MCSQSRCRRLRRICRMMRQLSANRCSNDFWWKTYAGDVSQIDPNQGSITQTHFHLINMVLSQGSTIHVLQALHIQCRKDFNAPGDVSCIRRSANKPAPFAFAPPIFRMRGHMPPACPIVSNGTFEGCAPFLAWLDASLQLFRGSQFIDVAKASS